MNTPRCDSRYSTMESDNHYRSALKCWFEDSINVRQPDGSPAKGLGTAEHLIGREE